MSNKTEPDSQLEAYDYGEGCPISMAASVIRERRNLHIIRELFCGSTKYSEIQKYIRNIRLICVVLRPPVLMNYLTSK